MGADGVYFGDVFGNSQQLRHRSEGDTTIIHIQAGNNDPYATDGELLTNIGQRHIKKLSFINTDDFQIVGQAEQFRGMLNGHRQDGIGIMGYDAGIIISGIEPRFKDFYTLVGNFSPFEPADEFLCFS